MAQAAKARMMALRTPRHADTLPGESPSGAASAEGAASPRRAPPAVPRANTTRERALSSTALALCERALSSAALTGAPRALEDVPPRVCFLARHSALEHAVYSQHLV